MPSRRKIVALVGAWTSFTAAAFGAAPWPPDADSALIPLGDTQVRWGMGGGTPPVLTGDCITPTERLIVAANIASFHEAHPEFGSPNGPGPASSAPVFEFYPMGGNWFRDTYLSNFVDLDVAAGATLDWQCEHFTYDGHNGQDNGLRGWNEKRIGVPIFAAKAGVVVDIHDGEPDENYSAPNVPANYVVLWHGAGVYTYYWHMKTGSVAVSVGEVVPAGRQIGLVASSGASTGPHLHFVTAVDGAIFETFAGACRPGPSGWADQYATDRTFTVTDCGFSPTDVGALPPTTPFPRTGHLAFSERPHWFWLIFHSLPANSTWRVRYNRPDGTLEYDSGTGSFGGNSFVGSGWLYWFYTLPNMGAIPGNWRFRLDVNGSNAVDARVLVMPVRDPDFNRPPAAIAGLAFDPGVPTADHAVFCRVDTSLTHDDPDFDVVRYTYVWERDGVEIRRITSAAHSDAISADMVEAGSTLRCSVTPNDGQLDGPTASVEAPVVGSPASQFDLAADFDLVSNPTGPWAYTWGGSPIGTRLAAGNTAGWTPHPSADGSILIASGGAPAWGAPAHDWPVGEVAIHAWSFVPLGQPSAHSAVRWVAPSSGVFDITGRAWDALFHPGRDASWSLTLNGVELARRSTVRGLFLCEPSASFETNLRPGKSLSGIAMNAGDTVEFSTTATTFFGNFMGVRLSVGQACSAPAAVAGQPIDASICSGIGEMSVETDAEGVTSVQWRVESPPASGQFVDLCGSTFIEPSTGLRFDFSGAMAASLRVFGVVPGSHSSTIRFQARVWNACGGETSNTATLAIVCCPADLSGSSDPNQPSYGIPDGVLDLSDFFYFLDQFVLGNLARADFTGSSDPNDPSYGVPDGSLDAADFFYYLDQFVQGCA